MLEPLMGARSPEHCVNECQNQELTLVESGGRATEPYTEVETPTNAAEIKVGRGIGQAAGRQP